MKIRIDFVTNSSSSNFILGFKDKNDYRKFNIQCKDMQLTELKDLIKDLKKRGTPREKVKQFIFDTIALKYESDVMEALHKGYKDISNFMERYNIEKEYTNTKKYKDLIKEKVESDEIYQKAIKMCDESEILIQGLIWDSDGGQLESNIRSGLLEQLFSEWLILQHDVG